MTAEESTEDVGLDPTIASILRRGDEHLSGDLEEVPEDRRMFFEGLALLSAGDAEQAARVLRKAQRRCAEPFSQLASYALGQAQRLEGKDGAALRAFGKVAEDETMPDAVRAMAWMSIAAAEEARDNDRGLERAREALAALDVELP